MASGFYNRGANLLNTGLDWTTADIRVLLVTNAYVPNPDDNVVSDVSADELSGGGYARQALAGRTATQDDANDRSTLDANDLVFPSLQAAAGTPQYAIVYYEGGGSDATRDLIMFLDLVAPQVPDGGDYGLEWSANGLGNLNTT